MDHFSSLLVTGNFDKIFENTISRKIALSPIQTDMLLTTLEGKIARIVDEDGMVIYRPFNTLTRSFFEQLLESGAVIETPDAIGSDQLENLEINRIQEITIQEVTNPKKVVKNGRYFPYINKTNINLKKYQIYTQKQAHKYAAQREHCLIHALQLLKVDEAILNNIKLGHQAGAAISKKDLHGIAEKVGKKIVLHTLTGVKPRTNNYGKGKEELHLCLFENHYFVYEPTKYSRYSILNYETVKDLPEFEDIYKKDGDKYRRSVSERKLDSFQLVRLMLELELFKKEDLSMFHENKEEHIYLGNIENEVSDDYVYEPEILKKLPLLWAADSEAFVYKEKEDGTIDQNHHLYMIGCVALDNETKYFKGYNVMNYKEFPNLTKEQQALNSFFNRVTVEGTKDAIVYFHNLKYDYYLFEKYIKNIKNKLQSNGQLYSVHCMFKNRNVMFKDSYKYIGVALSKFKDTFHLDFQKEEAIAYKYYTEERNNIQESVETYKKYLPESQHQIFMDNVKGDTFNPTAYYKHYLKMDCEVLKAGLNAYNKGMEDITGLRIHDYLTISSLTDKYMLKMGAYDHVRSTQGNTRAFIAKAIYGGRVHANAKYVKKVINKKIADFDGVSLYPSAIKRMCEEIGIPTGEPQRLTDGKWHDKLYAIMQVRITKVKKFQQIPMIMVKGEEDNLINCPPEEPVVIDSITLADYIKFHHIEYEVLDGIYWNSGSNKKMGDVIDYLFQQRKAYKKNKTSANNVLQNNIKLMLNSAYGKNITKKHKTKQTIKKVIRNQQDPVTKKWSQVDCMDQINAYVCNNYDTISSYRYINKETMEIEEACVDDSYTRGHVGCMVLSMSKRIMNEVLDIFNENKWPVYYTDTDSIHCNYQDVAKVNSEFKRIYGKELIGEDLGQFHNDFNLKGATGEVYSKKFIALGKKAYIDVITDGKIEADHFKLKGITEEGLQEMAKKYGGMFKFYEHLATGAKVPIVLNPGDKPMFNFSRKGIETRGEVIRTVQF